MAKRKPPVEIRKPPRAEPPNPAAVDAFIRGEAPETSERLSAQPPENREAQTSKRSDAQPPDWVNVEAKSVAELEASEHPEVQTLKRLDTETSSSSNAQTPKRSETGTFRLVKSKEWRRMTLYLPPELAKRLQVYCVGEDLELSEAVSQAVAEFLERRGT